MPFGDSDGKDLGINWVWPFLFIVPLIFVFTSLSGGYDLNKKDNSDWGWKNYDYFLLVIYIFILGAKTENLFWTHNSGFRTEDLGLVVTVFLLYALYRSIQIHKLQESIHCLHPASAAKFLSGLVIILYLYALGTDGPHYLYLRSKIYDSAEECNNLWIETNPKNECTLEKLEKRYQFESNTGILNLSLSDMNMKLDISGNRDHFQVIGYYPGEKRAYIFIPKRGGIYEINDSNEVLEGGLDKFFWNSRVNLGLTKERI